MLKIEQQQKTKLKTDIITDQSKFSLSHVANTITANTTIYIAYVMYTIARSGLEF